MPTSFAGTSTLLGVLVSSGLRLCLLLQLLLLPSLFIPIGDLGPLQLHFLLLLLLLLLLLSCLLIGFVQCPTKYVDLFDLTIAELVRC